MTQRVWTDRSRIETYQRCARLRWLEYHESGIGIVSAKKPLPLAVGGSVHEGLAALLMGAKHGDWDNPDAWRAVEDHAVRMAGIDFAQFSRALELPDSERAELVAQVDGAREPELRKRAEETVERARGPLEDYLFREQSALVEGLVRAYARRRLRPLLEQYEVLEVEREGSWLLSEQYAPNLSDKVELYFMSRPDALLRERATNELYILSFKTAADWDYRKEKDAQHDMQGLSEGVEVERRLSDWWTDINHGGAIDPVEGRSQAMVDFLAKLPAPPRILGIRYEYMLKGSRWKDKDLSATLGVDVRVQRSPLVRAYQNAGMAAGDEQWNVSWDYVKEDGTESKLYYKSWKSASVFDVMSTEEWIDKLDATVMSQGEEGREVGWSSPAQATGFLAEHPLDAIFVSPIIVYRNEDDLRDWVEQVEAQEVRVAEAVAQVKAAGDEGEKRSLLNRMFPQTRRACSYPTQCSMIPVCYGDASLRENPLGSGLYNIREANHPQEVEGDKS